MSACDTYLDNLISLIKKLKDSQSAAMETAARHIYDCARNGGMVYTFGTGHAHLLSLEIFYRAGGMVRVYPILDERLMLHQSASESSLWERKTGLAAQLLAKYPVKAGDVLIIFSNSGRNTVPVEMAELARQKGLYVIALTNMRHTRSVASRAPSGKKLFECADLVLDNLGVIGDASYRAPAGNMVGATSTAMGAAILQAITCRVAEMAAQSGEQVDFFVSSNVDQGDAVNEKYIAQYQNTIRCL